MLRSMFSAVSGLRAHQTMIDVVGNNIANVNTVGYKSTRATFREALTQVIRGGTAGEATVEGGVNPMQLGLGSVTGSIDGVFTQGASQATGRSLDVAIQGAGFLVVEIDDQDHYTRAGNLNVDSDGNLVGAGGELVQGWMGAAPDTTAAPPGDVIDTTGYTDITIGPDGTVSGRTIEPDADGNYVTEPIGVVALASFTNPGGLTRVGDGLFTAGPASGDLTVGAPGDGLGTLQAGSLEMSNVDLALEFTNLIIAQRGFQANSRVITASDELLQDLVNLKR